MTQHEAILRYMQKYGAITPMDAWNELHITKLSTRIGELIEDGYRIKKEDGAKVQVIRLEYQTHQFLEYISMQCVQNGLQFD